MTFPSKFKREIKMNSLPCQTSNKHARFMEVTYDAGNEDIGNTGNQA